MPYDINQFIRAINKRDATVIAPKGTDELERLEEFLGRKLGYTFSRFYSHCNGFFDGRSYLTMWTIDQIITSKNSAEVGKNQTIIGDILMESDYIIANLSNDTAEIKIFYEDKILSGSIDEFLENIALGKLDMFI